MLQGIILQLLQDLVNIKFCKPDQDLKLLTHFKKIIGSLNIYNVFNPSFYLHNNVKIFAFRAIPEGTNLLSSYISIEDMTGHIIKNISLDLCSDIDAIRLIDPKIVMIKNHFYITFNSGWIPEGNDIYIMKIYPKIESAKQIIYKNRQNQERNWAFFYEDGNIYALYSINPLKILKVKNQGNKLWEMEDYYCEKNPNDSLLKGLSIGTQLFKSDKKYYFIAHKKRFIMRKKIYFGKLCLLDFNDKKVRVGNYWLVHSLKSLFGSTIKTNTNLFSCTYFSGLQVSNTSIKLGYGINDVNYGFSTHRVEEL